MSDGFRNICENETRARDDKEPTVGSLFAVVTDFCSRIRASRSESQMVCNEQVSNGMLKA